MLWLPGDYEAQVGQRPIAIHQLEHLGATDCGITMFRQLIRRSIRTVRDGRSPDSLGRNAGPVIPTCCNDTVVCVPPAVTPEGDQQFLRETGRRLAEDYLKHPPLKPALEKLGQRIPGAVLVVGRPPTLQARLGLVGDVILQLLHQPRLPYAGLTLQHHHLAHSRFDPPPAHNQQPHFRFPGHQRR